MIVKAKRSVSVNNFIVCHHWQHLIEVNVMAMIHLNKTEINQIQKDVLPISHSNIQIELKLIKIKSTNRYFLIEII